jgi:hypothetical protein
MGPREKIICTMLVGLTALFVVADVHAADAVAQGFRLIRGEGSVCAAGNGVVQFHGSGTLVAEARGGQLILNDESAIVEIRGRGIKRVFPNGWVLYQGFNGTVRLEGEDLFGQIIGKGLRMKSEGQGVIMLMGMGLYRSPCDGPPTEWGFFRLEGQAIELGDYTIGSEEFAE